MLIARRPETSQGFPASSAIAVGPDAKTLEGQLLQALTELRSSRRGVAFDQLCALFEPCGRAGWDGADAVPVSAELFAAARDFLSALPNAFPSPEVAAAEDGGIALDWFPTDDSNFSIMVLPGRKLIFASVAPGRRMRGVEGFGEEIPGSVLSELRRLF